ncbi:MAG TPA: PVC-type heme-binding CxxCH protein, partial [Opitutales bacterium]|nr:PVC-type heme-binding CxxCH protein [Opitutales bacterium]
RKTVFTGFGSHMKRLNVQALLNNLTWGLDNRIHGATSGNGGTVRSLVHPDDPPVELRARDFSFDPKTLKLRAEAGGGQHGMSFDNRGQKIVSSNSRHLQALMYDERYVGRNPLVPLSKNLIDIPVDGPAAEVYRISPDEPWRIMRTKWRVEGIVPGIIEGGGRVSGYFTGASGGTIYRGDALPPEFLGNAFVGDVGGNLIHRKEIRYNGVEPIAERPADEQEVEFLASTDIWFRPVDFENAPDGSLYVLDMYREVIEHPWSLPEEIKKHLDLNSGNDRGRLYRIVPEDFEAPPPVRLGEMTTAELVETLAHPNGWHRDTAARLLYEKQDREAVPLLENLLENSDQPLGRLHAIYVLDGLGALEAKDLLTPFNDPDDRVRQHAVKAYENLLAERDTNFEAIADQLVTLSADPSPFVRYQLAFTLGEFVHPKRADSLAEIIRIDFEDRWIRAAALNSANDVAGELFSLLAVENELLTEEKFRSLLATLIGMVAAKNEKAEVADVVTFLAKQPPEISFDFIRTFGEGLSRAGSSIVEAAGMEAFEAIVEKAIVTVQNREIPVAVRTDAIRVLAINQISESGPLFLSLLNTDDFEEIQLASIQALDQLDETDQLKNIFEGWDRFTPRIRSEILTVFLKWPARSLLLLQAVKDGSVAKSDLSSTQIDFLREHEKEEIGRLTEDLFPKERDENRAEAIERFQVSLGLSGDIERGRERFQTLCASCHRDGNRGYALGPDLAAMKSAGKESLLANIIDPNAEVAPAYLAYLVETKNG